MTDHMTTPHAYEEKTMSSAVLLNGFSGLETSFGKAVITICLDNQWLTGENFMSTRPARIINVYNSMQVFLRLVNQQILLYSLQQKSGQIDEINFIQKGKIAHLMV